MCSGLNGPEKYVRPRIVAVVGVWSCVRVSGAIAGDASCVSVGVKRPAKLAKGR